MIYLLISYRGQYLLLLQNNVSLGNVPRPESLGGRHGRDRMVV